MTQTEILDQLPYFTGTENYYVHRFLNVKLLLTDGAQFIRESCQCYWLFDLIAQQYHRRISNAFTVVLRYRPDRANWIFTCTDQYTNAQFYEQIIPFSDFPLKEITLWVEGEVVLLPSER